MESMDSFDLKKYLEIQQPKFEVLRRGNLPEVVSNTIEAYTADLQRILGTHVKIHFGSSPSLDCLLVIAEENVQTVNQQLERLNQDKKQVANLYDLIQHLQTTMRMFTKKEADKLNVIPAHLLDNSSKGQLVNKYVLYENYDEDTYQVIGFRVDKYS